MVADSGFQLYLFGTEPIIRWGNKPLLITRKDALQLIAYTADQGEEEYSREMLKVFLFGDDIKSQRLREALLWFNKALRESGLNTEILHGQPVLYYEREMVWVDTREFVARAKRLLARSAQEIDLEFVREVDAVLELYKDHFLRGYLFDGYEANIWHENRQNELAALRHTLFEQVIQFHIYQGSLPEARQVAEAWWKSLNPGFVPLQYLIWLGLKRRLYGEVQHYLIRLQQYQEEEDTFFGPDVATWRLLLQNKEDPPLGLLRLPSANISALPFAVEQTLLDRSDRPREIIKLITDSQLSVPIGLMGLPGVGKTRFAQQLVQIIRQTQPNFTTAWVELTAESDLEILLNDVSAQLRLPQLQNAPYSAKQKRFKQLVRAYPCLVIIDEATSNRFSSVEFLETLTALFDGVKLVVIARELPGTAHYPFDLVGFDAAQIRQFLSQQIPDLAQQETTVFDAIAHITGGLPLVVNWLVGFLKDRRVQIKSFIRALSRLQIASWSLETAAQNYDYILNWLWFQLLPDEKNLLYTASMFDPATGVSFEDMLAIAASAFVLKPEKLQQKIDNLILLNLLQKQSEVRYTLHPILYVYIERQIEQSQQSSFQMGAIHSAYIQRFLALTRTNEGDFATLELHKNNMLRMFEVVLLRKVEPNLSLEIVSALNRIYDYFEKHGLYSKVEQFLTNALSLDGVPGVERVHLLHHLGKAKLKQGFFDEADGWLQQAWALATQLGYGERYSPILRDLGGVYLQKGDFDKAEGYLAQGKEYAQQQWLIYGQITANLGVIAARKNQQELAEANFRETADSLTRQNEETQKTLDYQDLSQFVEFALGRLGIMSRDFSKAEKHLQDSLSAARALNNPERIAWVYLNLGEVSYHQGDFESTWEYFAQGAVVAEYIQHHELLTWFMWNKGALQVIWGNYPHARRLLQTALNQATDFGFKTIILYIFVWLGMLHFCQTQWGMASKYFAEIWDQPALNSWFAALSLYGLGLSTYSENELALKTDFTTAYLQISEALDAKNLDRAKLSSITQGDLHKAHDYFQVALTNHLPGLERFRIVESVSKWLMASA